jgi:hypothetical protein
MSCVNITNEALPDGFVAGNGTIGTDEAKVSEVPFPIRKHIVIRADSDNDGLIMVGTPGHAAAGFILKAGETSPPIYVDNTDKVRVVADGADQVFSWISN